MTCAECGGDLIRAILNPDDTEEVWACSECGRVADRVATVEEPKAA